MSSISLSVPILSFRFCSWFMILMSGKRARKKLRSAELWSSGIGIIVFCSGIDWGLWSWGCDTCCWICWNWDVFSWIWGFEGVAVIWLIESVWLMGLVAHSCSGCCWSASTAPRWFVILSATEKLQMMWESALESRRLHRQCFLPFHRWLSPHPVWFRAQTSWDLPLFSFPHRTEFHRICALSRRVSSPAFLCTAPETRDGLVDNKV